MTTPARTCCRSCLRALNSSTLRFEREATCWCTAVKACRAPPRSQSRTSCGSLGGALTRQWRRSRRRAASRAQTSASPASCCSGRSAAPRRLRRRRRGCGFCALRRTAHRRLRCCWRARWRLRRRRPLRMRLGGSSTAAGPFWCIQQSAFMFGSEVTVRRRWPMAPVSMPSCCSSLKTWDCSRGGRTRRPSCRRWWRSGSHASLASCGCCSTLRPATGTAAAAAAARPRTLISPQGRQRSRPRAGRQIRWSCRRRP
mmetsp:Transcript_20534/g.61195  ORF Transcript_20534/g.61195 Transcript_20534/m.61195 type:complete len:256 (-) Transcript_20534:115-882(-)